MSKVTINGKSVEGQPKQVKLTVAGKELDITLVYVNKDEKATEFSWKPIASNEKLECKTAKVGNRVATSIILEGKTVFTNLTAQSVFAVISAKFNQPASTTNSIYTKSNPDRKESKASAGAAKVVITEQGNW
jgi:hypothetical protein